MKTAGALAVCATAKAPSARPTPAQVAWQNFEVGALVSLDLPVFAPGGWKEPQETYGPNLYRMPQYDTDNGSNRPNR